MVFTGKERPWLKVAEFAKLSGFDVQTVRRMLRSGELHGFKIGRQWLIPIDQFEGRQEVIRDA